LHKEPSTQKKSIQAPVKLLLQFVIFVLAVTSIVLLSINLFSKYVSAKSSYLSGNYLVYSGTDSKVLGMTSDSSEINVNFGERTTTSSPLVFGGAQMPDTKGNLVWDLLSEVGMTSVRKDFFLEYSLPNIPLREYQQNKNGIADPSNWKTTFINGLNDGFKNATKRNMKSIGIVSYAPPWLTHNKTQYGLPVDWATYEDIVKKLYRIHRDNLDYVEIWNEPSYRIFLQPEGSGFDRESAYLQIFSHATKALREVDSQINDGKRIKIGGPIDHKSDSYVMLNKILSDDYAKNNLDFISFHHYGPNPPNFSPWRSILKQSSLSHLPIFVTEWNYSPDVKSNAPELVSTEAIPFTGKILTNFIKEGIGGANYYSIFSLDTQFKTPGHGNLAFYKVENGVTTLLPQSKTWKLLSKTLALGSGEAEIFSTNAQYDVPAVAFKNIKGQYGLSVTNSSTNTEEFVVHLSDMPFSGFVTAEAFVASSLNEGIYPVSSTTIPITLGKSSYTVLAPPQSVIGIVFKQSGQASYRLDTLLRKLYQL